MGMENEVLDILQETVVDLVKACGDADLLDLVWKLLLECGVKAEG